MVRIQLAGGTLIVGLLTLQFFLGVGKPQFVAIEALITVGLSIWATTSVSKYGYWAPAPLFLTVLALFHLGLIPYWILGLDPGLPRDSDYDWFSGSFASRLILLSSIAVATFAIGTVMAAYRTRRLHLRATLATKVRRIPRLVSPVPAVTRAEHLSNIGGATLLGTVATWFVIAISAGDGAGVLVGPYQEFLALTRETRISDTYQIMGVALGLTLISPVRRIRIVAVLAFFAFVAFAFPLGLRGEILFPSAVALSVIAFRRRLPAPWITAIAGVFLLTLISLSKIVRQSGLAGSANDWLTASPLSALAEMGQSIRVLAYTLVWHDTNGEALRWGDTYTASFARALEALFSPESRPEATGDFRLMNSEIAERAGQIGGSAIAEAYHNFAFVGVLAVMLILGLVLGLFSTTSLSPLGVAVYASVALPLYNHVRNSFIPVIPYMLIALACLALVVLGSNLFYALTSGTPPSWAPRWLVAASKSVARRFA